MSIETSLGGLAANWPPDILEAYLAGVQKDRETCGRSDDEAMSTDEEDVDLSEAESSATTSISSVASKPLSVYPRPDDIASDDEGFSSDDEFGNDTLREEQQTRRALVLGRPPANLFQTRMKDLASMADTYITQLKDVDEEYAELSGVPAEVITRRDKKAKSDGDVNLGEMADADLVKYLRTRSDRDIQYMKKAEVVQGLVALAQALFRKERAIKKVLFQEQIKDEDEDDE